MKDRNGSHRADYKPTLVTVRSNALVCGRLSAGAAHSNPAEGMDVRLLFVVNSVGSDLCTGPKDRAEESYLVCVCVSVCDLDTSKRGRPRPRL
jgi:hypothetical protein